MKRLTAVLALVALTVGGGAPAWAQNVDPLTIGDTSPGALEGSYITTDTAGGQFQFLILASPRFCNDSSNPNVCEFTPHVWFYTAACIRVNDIRVPLTENDVEIISLHSPLVTSVRVGNVLVAGTPGTGPFSQPLLLTNSIIGLMYYADVNRGIGRIEELARLSNNNGNGWSPYKPAHVIPFALPDDGGVIFNTLLVRCPRSTDLARANDDDAGDFFISGVEGTLGGDMLDLASQDEGNPPAQAYNPATTLATDQTLCDDCETTGVFARALSFFIFDLNENFLQSVDNVPCQCIGLTTILGGTAVEARLRDISPISGIQATYWEITSFGPPIDEEHTDSGELFTASLNTRLRAGSLNLNFFSRLFNTRRAGFLNSFPLP